MTNPTPPKPNTDSNVPVLLTTSEAAALLRCAPATLNQDRLRRRWQVPYVRIGRAVRYDRSAVLRWLADRNPQLAEG